jgi:hypothetical protein
MWVNNDYQTYRQLESIQRNMTRKMGCGNFDSEMAIIAFMHAAEAGAKSYAKEFGGTWHEMFPRDIRLMAAEELRDQFLDEVKLNPQDYEQHVFRKDVKTWRERYPRESSVLHLRRAETRLREAARGGPNELLVKDYLRNIYEILDEVFDGNAINEWENAYEYLNELDRIVRDYGYALDR